MQDQGEAHKRISLRQSNLAAWSVDAPRYEDALDASFKKNSAYIKRLRSSLHVSDSLPGLRRDAGILALARYTSELVPAAMEGLMRAKTASELSGAMSVISALHNRFPVAFTVPLGEDLLASFKTLTPTQAFAQTEKEELARLARQRSLLRIVGFMESVALFRPNESSAEFEGHRTCQLLRSLLLDAKDTIHSRMSIAIGFCKHLGLLFLTEQTLSQSATSFTDDTPPAQIFDPIENEVKTKCKSILVEFYSAALKEANEECASINRASKRNRQAYIRSGEVHDDREAKHEVALKAFESLFQGLILLSEILELEKPTLKEAPGGTFAQTNTLIAQVSGELASENAEGEPVWLNTDEAYFYESLAGVDGLNLAQISVGSSSVHTWETLSAALVDLDSTRAVDEAAAAFLLLEGKGYAKRLIKLLLTLSQTRLHLVPYYARLIAVLQGPMSEIVEFVTTALMDDFRYLQRRRRVPMSELRFKTMRFLSELTKFRILPSHSILHCIKVLVDDLIGYNIDSLSFLLDSCGRFLRFSNFLNMEDSFTSLLETLIRKKSALNLDARQANLLESGLQQCTSLAKPRYTKIHHSPTESFVEYLLHKLLQQDSYAKVLTNLRMLDWNDPLIIRHLRMTFFKIWEANYSCISLFARLLQDLQQFHAQFCNEVVDAVLEGVRATLELNTFQCNQQRMVCILYIGEMYNWRLLGLHDLCNVLWLLLSFGHTSKTAILDPPTDHFRIMLICALLDKAEIRQQTDAWNRFRREFLGYFQNYVSAKVGLPPNLAADVEKIMHRYRLSDSEVSLVTVDHRSSDQINTSIEAIDEASNSDEEDKTDADFEKALADAIASANTDRASTAKLSTTDVSMPIIKRLAHQVALDNDQMAHFTVLTKRGQKSQVKTICIPHDSSIAKVNRENQETEHAERQRIKHLILENDDWSAAA